MVRKVGVGAGDRLARGQVLGLERVAVRRQDELRLRFRGRRARLQRGERLRDLARCGDEDVDVPGLEDAAQIGLVRLAFAEPLEGCLLVPEGLQEGERKPFGVKRLLGELGDGLFDLDGVHASSP